MTFRWEKLGKIFDPRDHQRWWLYEFSQAPATLLFDDRVRVYFSGRPRPTDGQYESYTGFADFDRSDPTKLIRVGDEPIMMLGGLGCFDEFGTYPVSVIRVKGKVWCYYAGWNRGSARFDTAIGAAVSHDSGNTFERIGAGPLLGASVNEPFVLSGPKIRRFNDCWYLFYIAGREWKFLAGRPEPVYKIRFALSNDGLHWARGERDLIENILSEDEVQSGPDVHWDKCEQRYVMLFCFRPVGNGGGLRIGYAWSHDLIHWTRRDDLAGITVSEDPAAWDHGGVRYPHWFEMDGEEYLLFNGNEFGRHGFGLARRTG
jgi:hypothetical protein